MSRAFVLAVAFILATAATPVLANDFCNQELTPLVKERDAIQKRLEEINKHAKDPGSREKFCATMGSFIANMKKTQTYMAANQDFCQIPGEALTAIGKGIANASATRKKICSGPAPQQGGPAAPGAPAIPKPPVELKLL